MKIYLDYIFLENLVVNIVIILQIIKFTKSKISLKRKVFIILLDTILSCFCTLNTYLNNYISHLIFSVITLSILFKPKNIYKLINIILCYYLLYFIYMGIIVSFSIIFKLNLDKFLNKIILYVLSGIFFNFFCQDLWKMWKIKISDRDLFYILNINGNKINAFVDTGNSAKDILTSLNVIFLKENLKNKIVVQNSNLKKTYINITTVNGTDLKEAYITKDVIVYKGKKQIAKLDKIILSFTLNDSNTPEKYSALIGYDTYLDKLEGVIL